MEMLECIKSISTQLNSEGVYDTLSERLNSLDRRNLTIGVLGPSNSGKSSLINAIAGTNIEVSYIASMKSNMVIPSSDIGHHTDTLVATDSWVNDNNFSIIEVPEYLFKEEAAEIEYASLFAKFDFCVYMIDAQMAFTKNDALILGNLEKFAIPTLVCISKFDTINEAERNNVVSYLKENLPLTDNVKLFNIGIDAVSNHIGELKELISSLIDEESSLQRRNSIKTFFIVDAIANLSSTCSTKLEECGVAEEKVQKITDEKRLKLSSKEEDWMRIELNLSERRRAIENKLKARLDNRKSDILRRLSHDLEVSSDVKTYWEKELSYRIDDMMRSELQACTQMMNSEIVSTLKWLQDETLKSFKKQLLFAPSVSCVIDGYETELDVIDIADNKNLRIISRIGTVATVFAAGTLLSTSGVAGILMAVSMLSGIGADLFIGQKTKQSREKVLSILPDILERSELSYLSNISESLKTSFDEIITELKKSHNAWREKSQKEIEEENAIAIFNCGRSKILKCMEQINTLSESLIS